METIFCDYKGENHVRIENGKSLFDEMISITSPNKKYCAAAGYWYINDENSDIDGDEIDGSAEAIVFENDCIAYRVKGIDELYDDAVLQNNGNLCVFDGYDTVSVWSKTEKAIKKKFPFSYLNYGITTDYIWAYGDGEDGNLRLSVFIFETEKMWTKRLSSNICDIKTVSMVKDYQISIYVVAETYDGEDTVIKYDAEGKKQEKMKEDIFKVLMPEVSRNVDDAPPERISDPISMCTDTPAKKKIHRWVIVVAIVVVILVLAGIMQP